MGHPMSVVLAAKYLVRLLSKQGVTVNSCCHFQQQTRPITLDSDFRWRQYLPMNLVLYSERLALAPFDVTDVDITIEMFTDPEVLRFAGGTMDEAEIRRDISLWTRRGGNGCIGIWCVTDRASGEKLGSAALLPMPVEDGPNFRITRDEWVRLQQAQ